mmetsp:Transcript_169006/g.410741  ORF Transcript_169006/g.410741 Transcript_169006/m.410741 type:complete len:972 (-) Transcript_169006:74-2989(-)
MADVEWSAHLRKVLSPHLEALRREVERFFPALEPELVLLHWLCQKHNLEPPLVSFRRSDVKDGKFARRRMSSVDAPRLPASAPAPQKMPPLSPVKRGSQESPLSTPQTAREHRERERTSMPPVKPGTPTTASPPWSCEASLELAGGPSTDLSAGPSVEFTANVLETEPPGGRWHDKTLERLTLKVQNDAKTHASRVSRLRMGEEKVTGKLTSMRHELRGIFLSQVPLLSLDVISAEEQHRLGGRLRPWTFAKYENVVSEGEFGDKLYVIEQGECEAIKRVNGKPTVVGRLGKGSFFGEIATLYDVYRTATVRTVVPVTALSLSRADLFATVCERNLQKMRVIARTQVFSSIPLLSKLSSHQMVKVAEALKQQRYFKGTHLALKNHLTERLHIVEKGQILMEARGPEADFTIGPGQFFGMMGLLTGAPIGYTVTIHSDEVTTLSISYEELLDTAEAGYREDLAICLADSMKGHLLRQIPQLERLADTFFQPIKRHAEQVHFKKWAVIQAKGAPIESILVLEVGHIVEHDGDADGLREELEKEIHAPEHTIPGEYFGVECLSNRKARAKTTLVALTDVTVLRLPQAMVMASLHEERQHIARIPLFSLDILSKAEQYMLVGKLKPKTFTSGWNIISQGEIGDRLFILEQGVCDAVKEIDGKEVVMSQLKKGSFFGELAVMYDIPRSATIRAATEVTVVSLSRQDLFSTIGEDKLDKMRTIARTQVFSSIPLLADLTVTQKIGVAKRMRSSRFSRGQVLVEEGQTNDRLYILERGALRLQSGEGRDEELIPFQCFGMAGLLSGAPYGCTVTVASSQADTLSVSLADILDTAGTGERPSLERHMTESMRCYLLRQIPQLKHKGDDYFHALLNHVEVARHRPGDIVVRAGSHLSAVYVVERGQLRELPPEAASVHRMRNEDRIRGPNSIIGADCLTSTTPVMASFTLEAISESSVLRVPVAVVMPLLSKLDPDSDLQ